MVGSLRFPSQFPLSWSGRNGRSFSSPLRSEHVLIQTELLLCCAAGGREQTSQGSLRTTLTLRFYAVAVVVLNVT